MEQVPQPTEPTQRAMAHAATVPYTGSEPSADPAAPPARIGPYSVLRLLGRGAMGAVYLAREESLGRLVALKVMIAAGDADARERFEREAMACASLSHPNVVSLLAYGEHDGAPWCAMEYVEGRNLAELLRREQVGQDRGASLLLQAAQGLAHAHERGVVHRDVKPSNLLVTDADVVKVADFGLARVEGAATLSASHGAVGTPSYMSPEQFASARKATPASDVWSLGATLYEVLTGRPPFHADSVQALWHRIETEDPIPPRSLSPRVSRDLETVCLKCLEKEPDRRYPDAGALAEELARWRRGEPVQARPISAVGRLVRRVRRNPLPSAAAVLVLAALAGGVGLAEWKASRQRRAEQAREIAQAEDLLSRLPSDRDGAIRALMEADERLRSADAPARRYEVDLQLGERALEGGDFLLARLAFSTCRALDSAHAAGLLARVDAAEHAEAERRKGRIEAGLDDLRKGLGRAGREAGAPDLDDYVFEVSGYRDAQTVALLAAVLRPLREKARRDTHWTQEEQDVMKFAFRVLGRVDLPSAVEPLASMMTVLWDHTLAVECGTALCDTRRAEAEFPLVLARDRIGENSPTWLAIEPLRARIPTDRSLPEPRTADEFAARGMIRSEKRDLEGAIQDFTRALDLDPTFVSALNNRGSARMKKGDWDAAIEDFTHALDLDPRSVVALTDRGQARQEKGDIAGAIEDYSHAIDLDPASPAAYNNRGEARLKQGDLQAAIRDCNRAIDLDPRAAFPFLTRGNAHLHKSEWDDAIQDYSRAIALDPRDAEAFCNRGLARSCKGDADGALQDFSRAIEISPRLPQAFFGRGSLRLQKMDLDGALQDLDHALGLDPRNLGALACRGIARHHKGDRQGAVADWKAFLDLAPNDSRAAQVRQMIEEVEAQQGNK